MARAAWGYSKRFVGLGTALLNRYRGDPFFRTEINVIVLQVAFGLVLLGLVAVFFNLLYQQIGGAILSGIQSGIGTDNPPEAVSSAIATQIENIKTSNFLSISFVFFAATALCGWLVARVTLSPARNALAAQKQFIGNIAHEIRTPLSVIKTNTEVTLLDPSLTAEIKQTLHSNVEELDRISDIINNLLSLSALIKPGRMEFGNIDLGDVAEETIRKFSSLAKTNEIQMTLRKSPDMVVWGSHTALVQILSNVLKNALTYTPRAGNVEVTVEPSDSFIALTVEDTGIGIARKDLFRIFEPFYRTDRSRSRSQGGSGLGLAIVSELIKLHQGKIVVRSAVGSGTSVKILFPAVRRRAEVGGHELRDGQHEIAVDFSKQ